MRMENYSPSHPTDDMDIEHSDAIQSKQDLNKSKAKAIEPEDDSSDADWKSLKSPVENIIQTASPEHSVVGTHSRSPDKDSKSKQTKSSKTSRRSRSHSVDKRSIPKSGYKRSRSRSKKRRSRSRNRKSHSRSRNKRSHSRSRNKRSDVRRSNSRSRNRRSRSKSNRKESRKDSHKPRGQERDLKKAKSRSNSPPRRPQLSQRDTNIIGDSKGEASTVSRSPETRALNERSDDNIFNKLTELRTVPLSDSPKEKWGCDSDEEVAPKAPMPAQSSLTDDRESSFSENRGGSFQNNRGNNFSNNRGGSFSNNRGSFQDNRNSSFQDNSSRFGNVRPFGDRQDYGDRRGRGSFRGQRGTSFGMGRFDNSNDRSGRNKPWEQNQLDSNRDNNSDWDTRNKPWEQNRMDPRGEQDMRNIPRIHSSPLEETHVKPWSQNVPVEEVTKHVWGHDGPNLGSKEASKNDDDSEDEFSSWGKKDKVESTFVQSSALTKREDIKDNTISDGNKSWGNDAKKGWADTRENKPWSKGAQPVNTREGAEGGFVAWKNAQRAEVMKQTVTTVSNTFADNSDEEFGAWGKESKIADNDFKVVADESVKKISMDSDDYGGAWGGEKKSATFSGGQKDQKNVLEDSDDEFGAWGSEQKATKAVVKEDFPPESAYGDGPSQLDCRQNFQNRNNFNSGQFGQQRGGPRNFHNNNQFQRQNNGDRPFMEQNNFNNCPPTAANDGMSQQMRPPFNYNQQHMPQWNASPQKMPNMAFQGGPMPFQIDTSVRPPMMNQMPNQGHPPPMQMMQQMSFIPPPPPNMSMHQMDMKNPSMGPGSMMSLMATMSQPSGCMMPSMSLGQASGAMMPGMGQPPSNMGQAPVNMMPGMNQPMVGMMPIRGQPMSNMPHMGPSNPGQSMIDNSNLLETLMAKAGLSSDTLKLSQDKRQESSKSVSDTFNTILKTAASSVISRFVENSQKSACTISDNMSMSPPSPPSNTPPPMRHSHKSTSNSASFVPPPLPNYNDVIKQTGAKISSLPTNNIFISKSSEVDEEKRNRSDFDSKGEWQDRVAMEIKMFLKPAYMSRSIDKNDYKEIMKRCVTKIIRSGVTEINTDKIEKFVLSYVEKYNKNRKMKQHSAVSSSEHDLRCD